MAAVDQIYLRFTKSTSTGTQTVTGVGFRGKALILWTTYLTSATATTSAEMCLGMTDGVRQSTRFIYHPSGETNTTSAQAEQTDHILWRSNATSGAAPTPSVQGVFTGFTDDGFTINFTTNDANATIIHALVIGGHNVQASFEQVKITVDSGGTIAVTGVGFEPTAFIVMGGAADEYGLGDYNLGAPFGSMHGFGFSNATDNVCGWTLGRGTAGAADAYRGQHTNRASSVRVANLSGAAELMGMRITAAGSDGFTITRDAGTTTHQPVQHILCLRGVQFALGSFTTPAGTGADTLALPFEPSILMFQTLGRSASALADDMGMAMGIWSADDSGGTWVGGVDASNPSVYRKAHFHDLILESRDASSGTVDLAVEVTAVDADGASLNYTTVPASANAVIYMALGPSTPIIGSAVFGVKTTVTATRAIALGLNDEVNVHDTPGTFKVFGDVVITGDLRVEGTTETDVSTRARVRVATTANITIATALNPGDTLDGVTLADGDLVLVKDQTAAEENGVYVVGATPVRSAQYEDFDDFPGSVIAVAEGTANADTVWIATSDEGGTIGVDDVEFAEFSGSSGTITRVVVCEIDGQGSVIATGVKGYSQPMPFAGTITKAIVLSTDASATAGSIVVDVWKDTYANYPPTNADSITASAPPTLSSANKSEDSTLSGWTTSVSVGDVFGFNVDSASGLTKAMVILEIEESL